MQTTQNNMKIITPEKINNNLQIGAKTQNLLKLLEAGCTVPNFVVITSDGLERILNNLDNLTQIENEIKNMLICDSYTVRSSALIEDTKNESLAGQFLTRINVEPDNIGTAMIEVINHASKYLKGRLDKFSLIIQEYIEPNFSGIAFTRNPFGSREMIIEFHAGRGEKIVGGEVKPIKVVFYWNEELPKELDAIPQINKAVAKFKELEKMFNCPQDIEWCSKNGTFYFLQTRPITTILQKQYEQIKFLETVLPPNYFYFEKTLISEIAPRPCTITQDLLKRIYAYQGPICEVYKKYKIRYHDTNFLKIIGNELFIDKEKELKSILPAYNYCSKNYQPKIRSYSGFLSTLKNLYYINRINTKKDLFIKIKEKIEEPIIIKSLADYLEKFLDDYKLVFEINLMAESNLKKLEFIIKKEDVNVTEIINASSFFEQPELTIKITNEDLLGNSLEIADETKFSHSINVKSNDNTKVIKWWNGLSYFKKKYFEKNIYKTLYYNRLREFGRWLVVKEINEIRRQLLLTAENNNFFDLKNIYFSMFEEIIKNKIQESNCQKRHDEYLKFSDYNLPTVLTNKIIINKKKTIGVSAGKCDGVLLNCESLKHEKYNSVNKILYTECLSPDLVKYFSDIKGIVSNSGGMLSHLAIIAREQKIPVIVNFTIDSDISIGSTIKINGDNGDIKLL